MTEREMRGTAALTAAKWVGIQEGSDDHKAILAIYNSIRPLPRGYAMEVKDPWCAAFVSAAAQEAGVAGLYPMECSCPKMIELAKEMGIWQERDDHVPKTADWVLYDWQDGGSGDNTGSPDHIGVVIGVEGKQMRIVEGNYGNAVKIRRMSINARTIRGFICPDYASIADPDEPRIYHTLEELPEWARPTIAKLAKDGSLKGVAEDDLGLNDDLIRTLVILDRKGQL